MKRLKLLGIALCLFVLGNIATAEATERWRVALAAPTNLIGIGDGFVRWAENINASGTDMQVKLFEPGDITPAFSVFDAVRDNKVPAGMAIMNYSAGTIPAGQLLTGAPFGLDAVGYASWYYGGEGKELTQKLLDKHGVHGMLCLLIGSETGGWFRKPLESVDDLRGLRFRTAGLGSAIYTKVGASVTTMPYGETFAALERGAMDAAEASLPSVDVVLGLHRVAKHAYFPGWQQPMGAAHLVINKKAWNRLNAPQQKAIETACKSSALSNYVISETVQSNAVAQAQKDGATVHTFPEDILAAFKAATDEVMTEQAKKDADFAEIYESMEAHKAKLAEWRELSRVN